MYQIASYGWLGIFFSLALFRCERCVVFVDVFLKTLVSGSETREGGIGDGVYHGVKVIGPFKSVFGFSSTVASC